MTEGTSPFAFAVLLIGLVAFVATILRSGLHRVGLADVIGYIALGLLLNALDLKLAFLSAEVRYGLDTLAAAGVVLLLFRVGLESNPRKLMRQLPRASFVFLGNLLVSAGLGYLAVRYLLGSSFLQAAFVAVALAATSVGVSLAVWREVGALDSDEGALLLDLAELDDVAAVILLALLLALAPVLYGMAGQASSVSVATVAAVLLAKLTAFGAACLLFARYAEEHLTRWLTRLAGKTATIVPVAGLGLVIAALAELLGFSLAIGALLAGLAFSRDPARVRLDRAFETLYRFFVPFFFVGIGLEVGLGAVGPAVGIGSLLLLVAVLGKVAGTALPLMISGTGGLLIGVSMVPRAEIALIVMERGQGLGPWAVSQELYGAMVFTALGTCLLTPPLVRYLLRRRRRHGRSD